ncbi:endolytic transglycosylase MltG [Lacibacter sp. H407]|uniref:endolytic transglycosylase MltG n=1 Tax=Lacibacter sp. H407 TaxID=3133423 RepID=UPI0030BA66BE
MKKIIGYTFLLLFIVACFFAWKFLGSATTFNESRKYLYINTGEANQKAVMSTLRDSGFLKSPAMFEWVAGQLNVWTRLQPGRYEIAKGSSLLTLARTLRNRNQAPVNLIITKLRTRNDLAALIGRKFETDSATMISYLTNNDSLRKFQLDTNTVMTAVFPNTYSLLWNSGPQRILRKLNEQRTKFWTDERKQKATALGLTPEQVHSLASIVEEETIRHDEKPTIASVYLNRLKKGMNLGADPTVKFAVGDFTLKRILFVHINSTASSPYNTYKNKGLPPGPICTPSETTIDAVLNPAPTDYLFFCAKPNGNGYHAFAATDTEHLKNARAYQQWLDSLKIR